MFKKIKEFLHMIFGYTEDKNKVNVLEGTDSGWVTICEAGTYTSSNGAILVVDKPLEYRKIGDIVYVRGYLDTFTEPADIVSYGHVVGKVGAEAIPENYTKQLIFVNGEDVTGDYKPYGVYLTVNTNGDVSIMTDVLYTGGDKYFGKEFSIRNSFQTSYLVN